MQDASQANPLLLTADEQFGILTAKSMVMQAKAILCDRQHELQGAQDAVAAAQRAVAVAQQQLTGAILFAGYARGLKEGNIQLSQDGTRIEV